MAVAAITWFAVFWAQSRRFSSALEHLSIRSPHRIVDNKIRVALIGDSWVAKKKLDQFLLDELTLHGWDAEILSFGTPGARSRLIYENLFAPETDECSSREVLFGDPVDVCVVIAGVNDSASYIGEDFYIHHMGLIMEALKTRGVFPFILELPEYGIEKVDSTNPVGFVRRRLMRLTYHSGKIDVISDYRTAMEKHLRTKFASDEYEYIDFDSITSDYHRDSWLYNADAVHLSEDGRRLLSKQIAGSIVTWLGTIPKPPTPPDPSMK